MEATIKFKDGTEIRAEMNGSCLILDEKPEFPEDLTDLRIESGEGIQTFEEAVLVECASINGKYWFTFIEKPLEQKQAEKIERQEEQIQFLEGCIMEMSEEVYK